MVKKILKFIKRHPDVQKWMHTHAVAVKRIRDRFESKTFFGFSLTLLVGFSIALLWILFGVIKEYLFHGSLIAVDVRIENLLFAFRTMAGVHFFYTATLFATPVTGIAVMAVVIAVFALGKQWKKGAIVFAGLAGSEGFTAVLKILFHRARPDLLLRAVPEDSFSMPSGHATTVAFVFGYLGYQLFLRVKSKTGRTLTVLTVFLVILLIDLSRMYLGVHYLSDVIAGNMIGLLGLCFVIGVDSWCAEKKMCSSKPLRLIQIAGIVGVAVFVAVCLSVFQAPFATPPSSPFVRKIEMGTVQNVIASSSFSKYTETISAKPQEPTSVILSVPDDCLIPDFQKAGWTFANSLEPSTLWKIAKAALFNSAYDSAPITPSFYDARPNDYGFERPTTAKSVRERHHARFWKTPYQTPDGNIIVGTASLDTGIKWGITHAIAPDVDTERDILVSDLEKGGVVASKEVLPHFVPPVLGKNFTTDFFFTNGDAVYLKLSSCK